MKLNKSKRIIVLALCLLGVFTLMSIPALAENRSDRILDPEDGMVSDNGEHMPLTPEAGTVEDGTGDGIIGDASSAFGDFSQEVSDAVSDVLGVGTEASPGTNASTSGISDGGDGGSIAAAVIICIIIAIAVIVLVIVLIPKKKD